MHIGIAAVVCVCQHGVIRQSCSRRVSVFGSAHAVNTMDRSIVIAGANGFAFGVFSFVCVCRCILHMPDSMQRGERGHGQ